MVTLRSSLSTTYLAFLSCPELHSIKIFQISALEFRNLATKRELRNSIKKQNIKRNTGSDPDRDSDNNRDPDHDSDRDLDHNHDHDIDQ